jgi:hypothetical protein
MITLVKSNINFDYLHSPGAGLVLHVDLEAQLALEGDHLLVHAGHLLNFRIVLKVDGNVGNELEDLVQAVIVGGPSFRLQVVVRQVETGQNQLEPVPEHHISHHAVPQGLPPVKLDVGEPDDTHVKQDANDLPDLLLTECRDGQS